MRLMKKILFSLAMLFAMSASTAFAADSLMNAYYLDTNDDGTVDHVELVFNANITQCNFDAGDWAINNQGDINISAINGIDTSNPEGNGDGACDGTDPVVYLNVTADSVKTGKQTAGGVEPKISYHNTDGNDSLKDSGVITDKNNIQLEDKVAPIFNVSNHPNVDENTTDVLTPTFASEYIASYMLGGGVDETLFSVDASSGHLTFKNAPNYEHALDANDDNTYVVIMKAEDGNFNTSADQNIFVAVQDVNEAPVITSSNTASVPENTLAVTTVEASDEDSGDVITYSISGGADQNKFTINTTGELKFNSVVFPTGKPDYEHPIDANGDNVYEVEVQATDDDATPLHDTQNIEVSVTDVSESTGHSWHNRDYDHDGITNGEEELVDSDNDGIPDYLESNKKDTDGDGVSDQYDSENDNPNNDTDKDGVSNIDEKNAGTDPRDAASKPVDKKEVSGVHDKEVTGDVVTDSNNNMQSEEGASEKAQDNSICQLFTTTVRYGQRSDEVKRVQEFLMKEGVFDYHTATGYYGHITDRAVRAFQAKYTEEILKPWGLSKPTGLWYKTTRAKANALLGCK